MFVICVITRHLGSNSLADATLDCYLQSQTILLLPPPPSLRGGNHVIRSDRMAASLPRSNLRLGLHSSAAYRDNQQPTSLTVENTTITPALHPTTKNRNQTALRPDNIFKTTTPQTCLKPSPNSKRYEGRHSIIPQTLLNLCNRSPKSTTADISLPCDSTSTSASKCNSTARAKSWARCAATTSS